MLYQLGQGMTVQPSPIFNKLELKNFLFTSVLPSEFTYTRNDTVATIRDNNGVWQQVAANTPRFDHDVAGNPKGMRFEPPRANKVNHVNFAPTTIGDIVVSPSGDGVASVVDDSAALATATINGSTYVDLQNGNAINLSGGTGGTTYRLSLDVGNLNAHSFRVVARAAVAGYSGNVKMSRGGSAGGQQNVSSAAYIEFIGENLAQDFTTRYLAVYVLANKNIIINAAQLEEGAKITSPIITNNSDGTAQRKREVCVATGLDEVKWFNTNQGAITGEFVFNDMSGSDYQYAFLADEGTAMTNSMGMYLATGAAQMRARDIISSNNYQNNDIHKPIAGKRFPCAISWKKGQSMAVAGAMTFSTVTRSGSPANMNRIYIGGRPYNMAMDGWIQSLTVYNKNRSLNQLSRDMFPSSGSYKAIGCGGQSQMRGKFRDTNTQMNGGEIAGVTELDAVWPTTENWMLNAAVDGSGVVPENNAFDYWIESVEGADGTALLRWKAMASAFGTNNIPAIHWDQGAADRGDTYANFYANTLETLTRMRDYLGGDVPVIINPISTRADQTADNYNMVKRVHENLAKDYAWIHLAPPQNKVTFGVDNLHLSDASYAAMTTIQVRKILSVLGENIAGAIDAPEISLVTVEGTNVSAKVTLPAGITNMTPANDVAGFRAFVGASEIAITAANFANGVYDITLESEPSGALDFYHGYGSMYNEISDVDNFPVGNDAHAIGLQNIGVTLPFYNPADIDFTIDMNITTAQDLAEHQALMDKAVTLGSDTVRIDVKIDNIVSNSGGDVYDWSYYDSVMAAASARGLNVLPILHYFPVHWLPVDAVIDGTRYALDPTYIPNFTAFIKAFDTRYIASPLIGVQVCNEVDNDAFFHLTDALTGAGWTQYDLYSEILKQLKTEYTGYTKNFPIIHAGLMQPNHNFAYLMYTYNNDWANCFDVFAYHGYHFDPSGGVRGVNEPTEVLDGGGFNIGGTAEQYNYVPYGKNIEHLFSVIGASKPIWITEFGYQVGGVGMYDITEDQAKNIVIKWLEYVQSNITSVERVFYYSMENAPSETFGVWTTGKSGVADLIENVNSP